MNKLFLPIALLFFQFFLNALGGSAWLLFDGPLALVVIYAFFHRFDTRDIVLYAVFCGLCRDIFSMDVFGLSAFAYGTIAFLVSLATRFINRHNDAFVFPVVFISAWLCPYVAVVLKALFAETAVSPFSGVFFVRGFLGAVGTTVLAVLLYHFWRLCGLGSTES